MNIDKTIGALEEGFQNPETIIKRVVVTDEQLVQYGMRRKIKGVPEHVVWMLSVGERGQAPTAWFLDHKVTNALKKGLAWRGVPPATRSPRGTRRANGAAAQPQQASG